MNVDPNQPAFPSLNAANGFWEPGIPLRLYIAAMAMTGYAASLEGEDMDDFEGEPELLAQHRVLVADWMLGYADALIARHNATAGEVSRG